ncbi:right-handed parallel beta-helix repeat-containing protein [Geoalkalibacter sp.]|uniref:right-handed parallel beta-helix repeat-containing protein n=1 Tax=Geoalkalibacter sp. TaxID=3041440 RepID=UPI00272E4298|nr:right-handed parallel beta-helix repeat-containing protein [Geoalkalibacter sp.]
MLLLLTFLFPVSAQALSLATDTHWQGSLRFDAGVRVEKGATLSVAPGTRVEFAGGALEVFGSLHARGARFEGEDWQGIVLRDGESRMEDCAVLGARTGVLVLGADPGIIGNQFTGNEIAIKAQGAARPILVGNQISGGGTGVLLSRRSDARLRHNRITGNRIGVQVEHSSYPVIRDNDLSGNAMALVLSRQSSAWEKTRGAGGRRPVALTGAVDAKNNWWGAAATEELERTAGRGNPSFIHDGRDEPFFTDEGKTYPLDIVEFAPWRAAPLTLGSGQGR